MTEVRGTIRPSPASTAVGLIRASFQQAIRAVRGGKLPDREIMAYVRQPLVDSRWCSFCPQPPELCDIYRE